MNDLNQPEKKEECGIFGILPHPEASSMTMLGLFALQHRGEEACGIASSNGKEIILHANMGHVSQNFEESDLARLEGDMAIGHTRYSVTGSPNPHNVQPLIINHRKGKLAVAHNGNLTNARRIRNQLEEQGAIFQTSMDSEVILHLIAKSNQPTIKERIIEALHAIEGAYSLLIMTEDKIYAARDPKGFRPLCLGKMRTRGTYVVCSETSALDLVNASYLGEVQPGELVTVTRDGFEKEFFKQEKKAHCVFELVYFSRPDSLIFNQSVYQFRKNLGSVLAKESPVEADMVVPVPDSGMHSALGFSQETNIPFEIAITRNHYVGRSFIQPSQEIRESFARIKLNPIKNVILNKRIVIVDDSIVRGTTTKERIKTLRSSGAKEVHMRVASPPIAHPCFYGIDFPDQKKLLINNMTIEEARQYLELDSLAYISIDGMLNAAGGHDDFCHACFSGDYPIPVESHLSKEGFE